MIGPLLRSLVLTLALGAGVASAQPPAPAASLDGAVAHSLALTPELLHSLPATAIDATFQAAKGPETGHYTGASLWALLERAGLLKADGKNGELRRTVLVTGRDGYAAAIAIGEIAPNYEAKAVILAYAGGEPAATPAMLRLIVPGDAHGGRSVRDVVHIEVR
jgi:hypothetical protein